MRKKLIIGLVTVYILSLAAPARCENPITKFSRGACNLATFHFEIFEQSRRVKNTDGWLAGMTYGLGKGIAMSVVRALVGAYEVVTFPIPYPVNYEPILKDPVSFFPEPKEKIPPQASTA